MIESIFRSAMRAFVVTFFGVIGICLGFIAIGVLFSSIEEDGTTVTTTYTPEILPNAKNVRKAEPKDAPVILSVNIKGEIGSDTLTTHDFNTLLVESREGTLANDRVKAILLNINSPGGTFNDADGIYMALKAYKEEYHVPVYAFVDGLCASGGMYVASAADEIYATDVSLIGSVGVVTSSFFNFSKVMEKVGMESLTLSAGKDKDELNPFRPWKPGEQDMLQGIINTYYDYFVKIVTTNRPKIDPKKLVGEYGAKIFPASESLEKGYIDGIVQSRDEALTKLLKKISIEDDYYQVIQLESKKWWSDLVSSKSPLFSGKIIHELNLGPWSNPKLMNKFLLLYQPGQ
jgi:signal peptide peptidase SppA